MVTAEFAVVLPAVVLTLALCLAAMALALDQVRCVDAAAWVSLATSGDLVRVSVVSRPRMTGSLLPAWLRASAATSAVREPSGTTNDNAAVRGPAQ